MIHQILGTSVLAAFRPGHDYRPALDGAAALGFNLVRTFCGPLPWCGQERAHVYEKLPRLLQGCADRGLNAYLSYCTEAGTGYDLTAHVSAVEAIARTFPAVVLREVANEPWHPTQGWRLDPNRCRDLAESMGDVCASLGAAEDDESSAYAYGDFVASHLSRSRDKWNQVRRVRELLAISEQNNMPCLNQEPIGADEQSIAGKRESDPAFYLCLGALNRLFLGGSGVFHSQSGLMAEPLGPNQRRCAEAYLRGATCWPGAHRLTYKNVGHDGGPFASANFDRVVRIYAGLEDESRGFAVYVGTAGEDGAVLRDGWQIVNLLGFAAGSDGRDCKIVEVRR